MKSEEDIEEFMNTEDEWNENTPLYKGNYRSISKIFKQIVKVTRVIAFVSDKSEYKDELKQLVNDARSLAIRDDLRIAKVINPKLVRKYKKDHKLDWFGEFSSNSIVMFRRHEDSIGNAD